ncbi:MAG: hypothetical protein RR716_06985 [Christensenellaceae bacterium]
MAFGKIKGITIEIGGDTTKLGNALKDINSKSKSLQQELREVDRLLKFDPTNTTLLAQKQQILTQSVEETSRKLTLLKEAERQAQQQFAQGKISQEQYRALQREVQETDRQLNEYEQQLKEVENASSAVSTATKNIGSSAEQAEQKTSKFGVQSQIALSALTRVGQQLLNVLGKVVKSVFDGINGMADYADDILTISVKTGISTENLQAFAIAAEQTDVPLETMAKGAAKVTKVQNDFLGGNKDVISSLDVLGVSLLDNNGKLKDTESAFYEIINAFAKMEDPTERAAVAQQLFGRSYQDLMPIFDSGTTIVTEQIDKYKELGMILKEDTLTTLNDYKDTMDLLKKQIATAFIPVLEELIPVIAEIANLFSEWLASAEVKQMITDIANALRMFVEQNKEKLKDMITNVLMGLINVFEWIINNSGVVITIIAAIAAAIVAAQIAIIASGGWVVAAIVGVVAAVAGLVALIQSFPTETKRMNDAISETNNKMAEWRSDMSSLDGSIESFSNLTNTAGQNLSDLQGVISSNQQNINAIYQQAFEENRELRQEEMVQIEEYLTTISTAMDEMQSLYQAQLQAQVLMLEQQLTQENLTFEQRTEIMAKQQTAQGQYTDSVSSSIEQELAALTMRLQRGEITQEEYSTMTQTAFEKQQQLTEQGKQLTEGIVQDNLSAMQQMYEIDINAFNNKTKHFTSQNEITQHYALKQKELMDSDTLNWFEKAALIQENSKKMMADSTAFALGQGVTYTDYNFMMDAKIQENVNKFFYWIGQNKSQGQTLSADSKQNALDIVAAYADLPENLQESGLQSLRGLAFGMAEQFPMLKDAASMDMDTLINTMNDALGVASPSWKMQNSGGFLMDGLSSGMNSKIGSLWETASNIANGLVHHFRKLFGVKSPSTIFADIGHNLGDGLAIGIQDKMGQVKKAAEDLCDVAISTIEEMPTVDMNINGALNGSLTSNKLSITATDDSFKNSSKYNEEKPMITVNNYSPVALSEAQSARLFKQSQRELKLGF